MAKNATSWQPGQSGNPKGAPKRGRALSEQIIKALNRSYPVGDRRVARKRLMAANVADLLSIGKAVFPDGTPIKFTEADEYTTFVIRLLNHLEGPAPSEHDVLFDGQIRLICDMPRIQPET